MVRFCAAYNCNERGKKGGIHSFHRFPKDKRLREKWVIAVRRKDFKPSNASLLCSKHFTKECFQREAFGYAKLTKDAVPTIFDYPSHIGVSTLKPRKPPKLRENLCSSVNSSPSSSITNEVVPEAKMDIQPSLSTPLLETQCQAKTEENRIKLESSQVENIDELGKGLDYKKKSYIGHFDSTDMTSPTKAVWYYELTMPLSIQPSLSVPLSIQPSLSTPLSETRCQANNEEHRTELESAQGKNIDELGKVIDYKRKSYIGDFDISDMTSPTKAVRYYKLTKEKICEQKAKIKVLRNTNERLKLKIENLTSVLEVLLEKKLLSDNASEILKETVPEKVQEVFKRMTQSNSQLS